MKSAIISKRKFLLLAIAFFACHSFTFAQTAKDVFTNSETPIIYLGIDFTKAKMIDFLTESQFDMRDKNFPASNEVVITEEKKYGLKEAFHKSYIDHDLGPVSNRNSKINAEEIKSTNTADFHRLQTSDIETLVRGFDFGDKKGVGLLFVCEGVSKSQKSAAFWVTLIDMKAKKVLMTERMEGKIGGFGMRNTLATGIKNVLDDIEKKKYAEWKTKYSN
ncbi:MAG TPA: hypothetical protein VKT28_16340 [Puia sp.]|nr:hypothetical protein [Puia sp.]